MKFKAIGINIYGGGFTLGVKKHFDVLGQWEQIKLGFRTFDLNFKGIHRPMSMTDWPVREFTGKVDFVYANPPCAPWSSANTRPGQNIEKRFGDSRLSLTQDTMLTALKLKPKVFISESVENAFNHGISFYDKYKQMWIDAGYSVTYFLTDAILHGSPSARRRFHFIAHKIELDFTYREPDRIVTVRNAIGDLRNTKSNEDFQHVIRKTELDRVMPLCKPGGKLIDAVNKVKDYSGPRPSFLCKRFIWDSCSHTMVNFNFVHPDGERFITVREALRLCTYPDTFKAHTPIEAVDAVLPVVAEYLAKKVKVALTKGKKIKPTFNVVDWRSHGLRYHARFYNK